MGKILLVLHVAAVAVAVAVALVSGRLDANSLIWAGLGGLNAGLAGLGGLNAGLAVLGMIALLRDPRP